MIRFFLVLPINFSSLFRSKQQQQQLQEILGNSEDGGAGRRRSSRKREDKSYVECPDIVIEEDYLSKPSPAKKANLSTGNNTDMQTKKTRASTGGGHTGGGGPGGGGADGGKEGMNKGSESGGAVTNGIEMESDEEESDDLFPPVPPPQVATKTKRQTHSSYLSILVHHHRIV